MSATPPSPAKPVRRRPYHLPSLLTVAGLALAFLIFIILAIYGNPFGPRTQKVEAWFDDVTGLKTGSPVLFLGMPVGKVESMEFDRATGKVRLGMKISDAQKIPGQVVPYLGGTMLGESFVSLRLPYAENGQPMANPAGPSLAERSSDKSAAPLEGQKMSRLESLYPGFDENAKSMMTAATTDYASATSWMRQEAEVLAQNLDDLRTFGAQLRTFVVGEGGNGSRLAALADQLQTLVAGTQSQPGLAEELMTTIANLRQTASSVNAMLAAGDPSQPNMVSRFNSILTDTGSMVQMMEKSLVKAQGTLAKFDQTSDSVKRASGEVGGMMSEMRQLLQRAESNNKLLYRSLVGKPLPEPPPPARR